MLEELRRLLTAYLGGEASRRDLRQWLAEFDWSDVGDEALRLRDSVGELDLVLEEVSEGLRSEDELRSLVRWVLRTLPSPAPTPPLIRSRVERVGVLPSLEFVSMSAAAITHHRVSIPAARVRIVSPAGSG